MPIKLPTWRHFETPNWRRMSHVFDVALELKDPDTQGHQLRVADSTKILVRMLRSIDRYWDHVNQQFAWVGARHHDMGKVVIDNSILLNRSSTLTPEQLEVMRRHPEYGATMLKEVFTPEVTDIILHHHQRWDGNGYPKVQVSANEDPRGLREREIPPGARAVCICDAFDAIVSKRSYKPAIPKDETVAIMMSLAGKQFDPEYVKIFCERVVPRL